MTYRPHAVNAVTKIYIRNKQIHNSLIALPEFGEIKIEIALWLV